MKWAIAMLVVFSSPFLAGQQWQNQTSTRSPHGSLELPCQSCHTSTSWKPIRAKPDFDHDKTAYPLRGMHASLINCTQCHTNLVFTEVGHGCADCHADIHRGQLGARCEDCHSVKGWEVSIRDIKQHQNRFPLVGAHSTLTCDSCHTGAASGQFAGLSTECISCHSADFQKTTNPNHTAVGFPTGCQQCHSMDSWIGVRFDHAKFTPFPLTGTHATLDCTRCHRNNVFNLQTFTCVSCHLADYNATTNPPHVLDKYPTTCERCHNTRSFLIFGPALVKVPQNGQSATFNHAQSVFPLTGAHASLQCSQCHTTSNFASAPTECVGCHLANLQRATSPNHVSGGFPQTCGQCHTTTTWTTSTFNHNTTTKFALTGAHKTLQCSQCHSGGTFVSTPTACAGCHLGTFQKTTNPNHRAAGLPTDCSLCHGTTNWLGASFDHSKTAFPLTGAHASLSCSSCHASGVFAGLPTACLSCHSTQFRQTANPNHVSSGFPQDCSLCHSTVNWTSATFNHNNTAFPLTGVHATVTCSNCHMHGNFTTTPADCYSCHKAQFTGTTSPNHVAALFPTTCQTCHTTAAWTGATFSHPWFPIYSGKHNQTVWDTCSACHVNPAAYSSFTCIACHTHTQAGTARLHTTVRSYVYAPMACYSCHKS